MTIAPRTPQNRRRRRSLCRRREREEKGPAEPPAAGPFYVSKALEKSFQIPLNLLRPPPVEPTDIDQTEETEARHACHLAHNDRLGRRGLRIDPCPRRFGSS